MCSKWTLLRVTAVRSYKTKEKEAVESSTNTVSGYNNRYKVRGFVRFHGNLSILSGDDEALQ